MHYYIDGYNLLFRTSRSNDNLRKEREAFIIDLEAKVRFLRLDVTLVFDSHHHPEEGSRSRFNALKICFTDEGETADDFIVDEIKHASKPSLHTVVTSDRLLADRCRSLSARTEKIEEFIAWLNKRYKNKLRQLKLKNRTIRALPHPNEPGVKPIQPLAEPVTQNPLKNPQASLEECFSAYLEEFNSRVVETEKKPKAPVKKKAKKKDKVHPQRILESDTDRWMRLFQQKDSSNETE